MTEQEKRRRRREIERRMRARQDNRGKEKEKGGYFVFRLYVAAVLVGGCLLISLFETSTSEAVCGKIKEVIAYQIPAEKIDELKEKTAVFLKEKEISLPVFWEKEQEEPKVYLPDTEASP